MYVVSIKGVVDSPDGEIVLLLNGRDEWELPGGQIEDGETPQACVAREIREELDIEVQVGRLIDTYLFEVVPSEHVFIVTYRCATVGTFNPSTSHEHQCFGLFPPDALPSNLPIGYRNSIQSLSSKG